MDISGLFHLGATFLMEGALGERLKREHSISFDADVAMAGLVYEQEGRALLEKMWIEYADTAARYGFPFMATTATRRANKERVLASRFGASIIRDNMALLQNAKRSMHGTAFVGGLMGCKGDAYSATDSLSIEEAERFHSWQADAFADAGADFLMAGIMPALPEAAGMSKAMAATGLSYIISFMIQPDGTLIDGTPIHQAIAFIDSHVSPAPLCYMTNCVHPLILHQALTQPCNHTDLVYERFRGIQANTSPLSPQELDKSAFLHTSPPDELAAAVVDLRRCMNLSIAGGCCGTDDVHMEHIAQHMAAF